MTLDDRKVYEEMARKDGEEFEYGPGQYGANEFHEILLSDILNYMQTKGLNDLSEIERRRVLYGTEYSESWIAAFVQNHWDVSLPFYEQQSEECKKFIRRLILQPTY